MQAKSAVPLIQPAFLALQPCITNREFVLHGELRFQNFSVSYVVQGFGFELRVDSRLKKF